MIYTEQEQQRLAEKRRKLAKWASTYHVEMHFYLMTQQRFRNERYSDPLTKKQCSCPIYVVIGRILSFRCTPCG